MHDLVPVDEAAVRRSPSVVALEDDTPRVSQLFAFMAEAELRFESLRMRIVDRTWTARGEQEETVEVAIRHPGAARIVRRRDGGGLSRDYDIWVTDGRIITAFDARSNTASVRPVRDRVVGATDPGLPSFARVWVPRTPLPPDSLAEAFVHPRGLCRNVLSTGPVSWIGTRTMATGREALLLRVDHPRTSHLLTDRPDRWVEVGVDRMTGVVLGLEEHIGDRTTRQAEVVDLELDPELPDGTFMVHLSSDVHMLY